MPDVKISDVVVPEVLSDMVSAQISNYIDFVECGAATLDYGNADIKDGGNFANIPFYKQLTGDDEVMTDDTSLTPQKITTGKDIGVVCHRGKAWSSRDLAAILSGDNPMDEIAKQVASYWGKRKSIALISTITGAFTTTLPSTHSLDVAEDSGTAELFSHAHALNAMNLVGDAMNDFDMVLMHSHVFTSACNAQLVSFPQNFNPSQFDPKDWAKAGRYLGKRIIISDYCTKTGSGEFAHYSTFFVGKGALYLGFQKELQTEKDRDILAFKDVLSTQVHFVPHVRLVKWNVTDTNPTNTALETGSNWSKVADDDKFIKIVRLITN